MTGKFVQLWISFMFDANDVLFMQLQFRLHFFNVAFLWCIRVKLIDMQWPIEKSRETIWDVLHDYGRVEWKTDPLIFGKRHPPTWPTK